MKIALVQMQSGQDKEDNLKKAQRLLREAAATSADLIVFPESLSYRGPSLTKESYPYIAEAVTGSFVQVLKSLAKELGVSVILGSMMEASDVCPKVYNTLVGINNLGDVDAIYRKRHLFSLKNTSSGLSVDENQSFLKGTSSKTFVMGDWKMGLSICFDLRFPEIYQSYRKEGCQLMVVPAVFLQETGQAHWEVLLRARAIENLSYVLAVNQVGQDERGVQAYGHSMVVDPWGNILAEASSDQEEIVYAELRMDVVDAARRALPLD